MMKIFSFILLIITGFLGAQVRNQIAITPDAKVGLSLAGGGAKGFAHVGALKVLDSLGVKIDYISGTSMGAIVGGLYASGYTGKEIEKIILNTDFYKIIANEKNRKETPFFNKTNDRYMFTFPIKDGKVIFLPKAISTGQKNVYMLNELLKNTSNVEDFSKMPIPFMCVATNLETGKKKIFQKGNLVNAIMASAAYPSLMDPVKIGDSLYIDGAMTMNYPSEPLKKKKGMDIVVGVDLSQELAKREDLQSAVSILNQVIDFGIQEETKNQYLYTDINIHPNLDGLDATSYGDKKRILDSGYAETLKYVDILNKLPKRKVKYLRPKTNDIFQNVYRIDSLEVLQSKVFNKAYIQGKMNLKLPSIQTYGTINKMIDKLYATNNYNLINYDIIQSDNHNILKLTVTEDKSRFFIKLGLHYDEVFKSGFLVNATAKRFLFRNSITSFDVVLGDNPRYYFNYVIDNGYIPGGGISASGMQLSLKDSKGDIFEKWNWFRSDIFVQSVWKDRYAIGGGLSHDYFQPNYGNNIQQTHFVNTYVFIKSDTQDDSKFATRGFYMNAEGKILDLFNKDINRKLIQSKINMHINFPVTSFFTYRLNLFGGFTLGEDIPHYYYYRLGAIFEQDLGNFVRLDGFQFGNLSSPNLLVAYHDLQFRIKNNYFLIGSFNMVNTFNKIQIRDIVKVNHSSVGLTAGYKTPFGQIKFNYSKSLGREKGLFSVVLGQWF